jgi:hypothetical protein
VPVVSSYHFLIGPLVASAALLVIVLMCRWVFSTKDRDRRAARRVQAPTASRSADYGLLVPIASVRTREDAEMLRGVLAGAGIRCTVAADATGADVLVFRADALRARDLVSS